VGGGPIFKSISFFSFWLTEVERSKGMTSGGRGSRFSTLRPEKSPKINSERFRLKLLFDRHK